MLKAEERGARPKRAPGPGWLSAFTHQETPPQIPVPQLREPPQRGVAVEEDNPIPVPNARTPEARPKSAPGQWGSSSFAETPYPETRPSPEVIASQSREEDDEIPIVGASEAPGEDSAEEGQVPGPTAEELARMELLPHPERRPLAEVIAPQSREEDEEIPFVGESEAPGEDSAEEEEVPGPGVLGFQPVIELALPDKDLLTSPDEPLGSPERLFAVLYWHLSPGCSPDVCSSKTGAYARRYDADVVFLVGSLEGVPERLRKLLPEFAAFPGRGICTLVREATGPREARDRGFVDEVVLRDREQATDLVRCSTKPGSNPLDWDHRRLRLIESLTLPESLFFSASYAQIHSFTPSKKAPSSHTIAFGPCTKEEYVPDF